jgi:hypothetical protein
VVVELHRAGMTVAVHDPLVVGEPVSVPTLNAALVSGFDAVAILVDHAALDLPVIVEHAGYVFDACGCLAGANVERL